MTKVSSSTTVAEIFPKKMKVGLPMMCPTVQLYLVHWILDVVLTRYKKIHIYISAVWLSGRLTSIKDKFGGKKRNTSLFISKFTDL